MRNRNIILIVSGVTIMVIALTVAVVSCRTSSAAPAPVSTEQVEREDCDAEDRANKEWTECGLGVLDPKKTTKPPAPKTPATKKTRR